MHSSNDEHFNCFHYLAIMNMLLTLVYKSLFRYVSNSTSIYLGVELLGLNLERLEIVYKLRVPENQQKGGERQGGVEEEEGGAG